MDLWNEEARVRLNSVSLSNIWEQSVGIYAKEDIPLTRRLRFIGGLRYDRARFEANGASGTDAILSPKASLYSPRRRTSIFLSITAKASIPMTRAQWRPTLHPVSSRAKGVEVGARGQALDKRLTGSLVFWAMDLDSELTSIRTREAPSLPAPADARDRIGVGLRDFFLAAFGSRY